MHRRDLLGVGALWAGAADLLAPSDNGGEYMAFVYGYIRALMQAAGRTA